MLKKIILLSVFILTVLFFYFVILHYLSGTNIKKINLNRSNIEENLTEKSLNLPFLDNDTNNVVEFNSGFNLENKTKRKLIMRGLYLEE